MPRDKKESHERIIPAARREFIEKGFEKASIRTIAANAGLTSAALYRHFASKEDMFNALVQPGIMAMNDWMRRHEEDSYAALERGDVETARNRSEVDMIREVVFPHRDSFKLLLCCACRGDKPGDTSHADECIPHGTLRTDSARLSEGGCRKVPRDNT